MSMIASLYQVDRAELDAAVAAGDDAVQDFLAEQDELPDAFNWSGYVMLFTMEHLADAHGIALTSTALDSDEASIFIFGSEHQEFVPLLSPERFDQDELGAGLRSLSLDLEEAGMAALDVITVLRDELSALTNGRALVVSVG